MRWLLAGLLACPMPSPPEDRGEHRVSPVTTTDGGTWRVLWFPVPDRVELGNETAWHLMITPLDPEADDRDLEVEVEVSQPETGGAPDVQPDVTPSTISDVVAFPITLDAVGWWRITVTVSDGTRSEDAIFDHFCCALPDQGSGVR